MTIRKMWMIVLILISVLSVGINTIIFTTLTDKYFTDYLKESYDLHIEQILDYVKTALSNGDISYKQMAIEMETHLNDPIIQIKVYNPEGDLLVDVEDEYSLSDYKMNSRMGNRMMETMMGDTSNEVNQYEVMDGSEVIGVLNITLHSVAENSFVAMRFKGSLLANSMYAVFISITISILIGFFISSKMSRSLRDTSKIASAIQLGDTTSVKSTSIKEIQAIRDSLEELDVRLRLKQKSRQVLVDQLIHQTRTPLTILKSHLEAIEDGLVDVDTEEIRTFQNQIEHITTIISNMSGLIDASKDLDTVSVESFELNQMLKQIINGLKAQFTNKNINLELMMNDKLKVYTDKDKLSQSIYNILTNAYKYTNETGSVRVSYGHYGDHIVIKIQDTGLGIADHEIDKIFNAYYRSDQVLHVDGDGIGLYIVKDNIKTIGGTISVMSELNVGSTFSIEIPIKYSKE